MARTTVHVAKFPLAATELRVVALDPPRTLAVWCRASRDGRVAVADGVDPESFSAGRAQFDSDITDGRHPRAALGLNSRFAIAVAADGRSDEDAGLTLAELARLMARLGACDAINLDGGGSTSLVTDGSLVNRPRDEHGAPPHGGRRICTAVAFVTREIQCASDDLAAAAR